MYGDLDANLDELMREDEEPAEPTSAKIYRLLHLGWNRSELKAALRLCREVPWGTNVVEEIHASGACVRKLHPEIAYEPLRIRAHVHALRRVLPTPSAEEKKEHRLQCRLGEPGEATASEARRATGAIPGADDDHCDVEAGRADGGRRDHEHGAAE